MPVRVDHARHQRPSAAVNDVGIGNRVCGRDQSLDEFTFDQNTLTLGKLAACPVENIHIAEQDRFGGTLREARADHSKHRSGKARCDTFQNGAARQSLVDACK
jgi:hypothetical protein